MATAAPPGAEQPPSGGAEEDERTDHNTNFECNICLDTAKDAVISFCGHLFCWPCLHQWMETRPNRQMCPVCKAGISKEKVIPLYGRGSGEKPEDPREKLPPRPSGQRSEPESQSPFSGFEFNGGAHMTFGIGAFPFTFFAQAFNMNDGRPGPPEHGTEQFAEERNLSQIFLLIGTLFLLWLLMA